MRTHWPFPTSHVPCVCCGNPRRVAHGGDLRAWRDRQRATQPEIADTAGVSVSLISQVENGTKLPSPAVLDAYRTLRVSPKRHKVSI